MKDWESFVLDSGAGARLHDLAAVLGQPARAIERLRNNVGDHRLRRRGEIPTFRSLFVRWHGREPQASEWPAPAKVGRGLYVWQEPELALLATLVGAMSKADIAKTLTARLVKLTKDPNASRSASSVQVRMGKLGLIASDVLGGVTIPQAGREIGSEAIIRHAVRTGALPTYRCGRILVIPSEAWSAWKASRPTVPENYIRLASIRESLGIRSDKLSEFARAGLVPTAVCITTFSRPDTPTSRFGTWFIDRKEADRLVAARRAGEAMPWHGKPLLDNLRITHRLWRKRKHPSDCETCRAIWGRKGPPSDFADYLVRYPPLAHGAKRHLTMKWHPGLTLPEVARHCRVSYARVCKAARAGLLRTTRRGKRIFASRTDATRWLARKCPDGASHRSWISFAEAVRIYHFPDEATVRLLVRRKKLASRKGSSQSGSLAVVSRDSCRRFRDQEGYTSIEAARLAKIALPRLKELLQDVDWRGRKGIPLETVQAVIKREHSREGYSIQEAAAQVRKPVAWVEERIHDGTVRLLRTRWKSDRLYLSKPMLHRLLRAAQDPACSGIPRARPVGLRLSAASMLAGVSNATLTSWAEAGELPRTRAASGWFYKEEDVKSRARVYWASARSVRALRPDWWLEEQRLSNCQPHGTGADSTSANVTASRRAAKRSPRVVVPVATVS